MTILLVLKEHSYCKNSKQRRWPFEMIQDPSDYLEFRRQERDVTAQVDLIRKCRIPQYTRTYESWHTQKTKRTEQS